MTAEVAPDGSPVAVYRRLPAGEEAGLIDAAIPAGGGILELGAGAGRLTHELLARGHPVTAVDQSPEMLAEIRGADVVLADVETLELGRRFAAVLLASHFVNDSDPSRRRAYLEACARHAAPAGAVLVQCYDSELDWQAAVGRTRLLGEVAVRVAAASCDGSRVAATVEYELDGHVWRQDFTAEMLDESRLTEELSSVGLRFERWLDRSRGWFLARA